VRVRPPLAREVARDLAIAHGGCIRPIQVRRTMTTARADGLLTVEEAADWLRVSRWSVYNLIRGP
jgi:hypothetical protein